MELKSDFYRPANRPTVQPPPRASIRTFTGKEFTPLAPNRDDIDIRDIAHSLSLQCRFAGHVLQHYSVCQHSVSVCDLVNWKGGTSEEQLWALLHDASEAYLGDLSRPLKHSPYGQNYRTAEFFLQSNICIRFGLPTVQPEIVYWADDQLLRAEFRDLFPREYPAPWAGNHSSHCTGETEWTEEIWSMLPAHAEDLFLQKFKELTDGR